MTEFDLQPTLVGDLIRLRPLRPEDFEALYAVAADPEIWAQHPRSDRHDRAVFKSFFDESLSSGGALVAADTETGELIGSSRYYDLDATKSQVVIGFTFLRRNLWGGAYNLEMKRLMVNHALEFVSEVRFHAGERNFRSRRALEKIGAQPVGHLRQTRPDGSSALSFVYALDARL